jgi:hypothetical protein
MPIGNLWRSTLVIVSAAMGYPGILSLEAPHLYYSSLHSELVEEVYIVSNDNSDYLILSLPSNVEDIACLCHQ